MSLGSCGYLGRDIFLRDPSSCVSEVWFLSSGVKAGGRPNYPPLEASPLLVFIESSPMIKGGALVVHDLKVFSYVHFSSFGAYSTHTLLMHFFVADV